MMDDDECGMSGRGTVVIPHVALSTAQTYKCELLPAQRQAGKASKMRDLHLQVTNYTFNVGNGYT
jgi:hypothetical protein